MSETMPSRAEPRPEDAATHADRQTAGGANAAGPRTRPDAAPSSSGMLEQFGLPLRLLSSVFFDRIKADPADLERVKQAAARGSLVYVMRTQSLLDYLFFNHFLRKYGLPLARVANGVRVGFFAPIRKAWAALREGRGARAAQPEGLLDAVDSGELRRSVEAGDPALVFLRRSRDWPFRKPDDTRDLVEVLVEAQALRSQPIYLVPQVLVWERRPDRSTRGLFDVLLGDPENPGRIRKLLHFLLYFRSAVVRFGEPLDLREFVQEQEGQPVFRVAKKLRWMLLGYLYRERKVVKGPDVRPRRWIFDRILAEPAVKSVLDNEVASSGKSPAAVEKRARKILDKTGADFKWDAILFLRAIIDVVASRIYSGVEFAPEDAERIRAAARRGTVLLLPSHRSHFDYLLLSWVLYHQGMMPPHIAAGINLSFWPVGSIFRQAGAFFIRRSFQGDELYSTLLNHYVRALISEGYTQEFFIEGGRSRTGKMLPAKVGMLWTYVEAMADRIVPDIQAVPLYIAYEKIVEDYTKELAGGEKKKESAGELVKGVKVLRHRFGRVYVKANEPISFKEAVDLLPKPWRSMDSEERKAFLRRLAQHICAEIQDVTVVTPSAVAALVLLSHDRRGITKKVFLRRARFFTRILEARGGHFSDAWHFPDDALEEAVQVFADGKLVQLLPPEDEVDDEDEAIIAISDDPRQRTALDYYKNNILFHFVPGAFVCTALVLTDDGAAPLSRLQRRFDFLMDLFQEEFVFHPDVPPAALLGQAARLLQDLGVLEARRPGGEWPADRSDPEFWLDEVPESLGDVEVRVADWERAILLMQSLRNFFEAYYVVLKGSRILRKEPLAEDGLVDALMRVGRRMYLTEDVTQPESATKVNLTNAVRQFRRKGALVPAGGDSSKEARESKDTKLGLDEELRDRYLGTMRKLFHSGRLSPSHAERRGHGQANGAAGSER